MPNSRQLAILVWLVAGVAFCLTREDLRRLPRSILGAALQSKVVGTFAAIAAWVAAEVIVMSHAKVWDSALTTDTIFWVVGSASVTTVGAITAPDAQRFLIEWVRRMLSVVVILGVFMSISVFSLPVELVLQPVVALLGGMAVLARYRPEYRSVGVVSQWLLLLMIAAMLVNSAVTVGFTDEHSLWPTLWRSLLLPAWLFVGLLPLVWAMSLYASYESVVTVVETTSGRRWGRRFAILTASRFSQRRLRALRNGPIWNLNGATSFRTAREALRSTSLDIQAQGTTDNDLD